MSKPTKEWVGTLSKEEIIACNAYHFRKDHFSNGSLLSYSVGEGYMLTCVQGYLDNCNK